MVFPAEAKSLASRPVCVPGACLALSGGFVRSCWGTREAVLVLGLRARHARRHMLATILFCPEHYRMYKLANSQMCVGTVLPQGYYQFAYGQLWLENMQSLERRKAGGYRARQRIASRRESQSCGQHPLWVPQGLGEGRAHTSSSASFLLYLGEDGGSREEPNEARSCWVRKSHHSWQSRRSFAWAHTKDDLCCLLAWINPQLDFCTASKDTFWALRKA